MYTKIYEKNKQKEKKVMKRVNVGYIVKQVLCVIVIASVVSLVAGGVLLRNFGSTTYVNLTMLFGLLEAVCLLFGLIGYALHLAWGGSNKKSKKTFEAGLEEYQFKEISRFNGSDSLLAIDGVDGRIAYVSNLNPLVFQCAELKDISDVRTDLFKGPLGGASAVWFSFIYKGKKTKVYTFLSNQAYSLKSKEVLEAISKADMYVDMLKKLKEANNV